MLRINPSYPAIRLELERMKYSILSAINAQHLELESTIERAIEEFCQPANIKQIIHRQVNEILDRAIRDEVDKYYRFGKGNDVVKKAVIKQLSEDE